MISKKYFVVRIQYEGNSQSLFFYRNVKTFSKKMKYFCIDYRTSYWHEDNNSTIDSAKGNIILNVRYIILYNCYGDIFFSVIRCLPIISLSHFSLKS